MINRFGRARRGVGLVLCGIILFLGYRPATAILAVAGCAHNPTEGAIPGQHQLLAARENKPRPSKQKLPAPVLRVKKERGTNPDPRLRKLLLLQENSPDQC